MNASDALIKTLISNGAEVVFANPGTSEMHLVAAIDTHPEIRPVLGCSRVLSAGRLMATQGCQANLQLIFCIWDQDWEIALQIYTMQTKRYHRW